MKKFFINWGLYCVVVLAFVLVKGIAFIIEHYQIPVIDLQPELLLAPKVTFLSVILALGMFQYNYFYSESKDEAGRLERGDFGPLWSDYVRQAEQLRQFINTQTPTSETSQQLGNLGATLNRMDEAISRARAEFINFMKGMLLDFSMRLALILSIGVLVFSSLAIDVLSLIGVSLPLDAPLYSQSTFLTSLVLFFVLILLFLSVVQSQFRWFNRLT